MAQRVLALDTELLCLQPKVDLCRARPAVYAAVVRRADQLRDRQVYPGSRLQGAALPVEVTST